MLDTSFCCSFQPLLFALYCCWLVFDTCCFWLLHSTIVFEYLILDVVLYCYCCIHTTTFVAYFIPVVVVGCTLLFLSIGSLFLLYVTIIVVFTLQLLLSTEYLLLLYFTSVVGCTLLLLLGIGYLFLMLFARHYCFWLLATCYWLMLHTTTVVVYLLLVVVVRYWCRWLHASTIDGYWLIVIFDWFTLPLFLGIGTFCCTLMLSLVPHCCWCWVLSPGTAVGCTLLLLSNWYVSVIRCYYCCFRTSTDVG